MDPLGPCPENWRETDLRSSGRIELEEDVSRQHSIQAVLWLLLTPLAHVYSGTEHR